TKRARFLARLRDAGLGDAAARRLVCPIGVAGIEGKEPAVIAAAAAAQVLQWREAATEGRAMAASPAIATAPATRTPAGKAARPLPGGQRRAGGR
ncbi:MAG: XdhC family protein, partial [Alsobacter sp.]